MLPIHLWSQNINLRMTEHQDKLLHQACIYEYTESTRSLLWCVKQFRVQREIANSVLAYAKLFDC